MMDYAILVNKNDCDLANEVIEYMKHGWRPQGGVSMTLSPPGLCYGDETAIFYSQAMIHQFYGAFQPGVDEPK